MFRVELFFVLPKVVCLGRLNMAKLKRTTTKKQIEKKLSEGRGQGRLEDYTPWIKIQDFASKGISPRTKGWKTNREHHFLSQLELKYFFLLEWSQQVIDIREQFPLDLEETITLAKTLNIPHPPKNDPKNPQVITTDFLITIQMPMGTKEYARTIKYSTDLASRRVLEKFEIERVYWSRRNINWGIVTELDIDSVLSENAKTIHTYLDLKNNYPEIQSSIIEKAKAIMTPLMAQEIPIWEIGKICDQKLSLKAGMGLTIIQHFVASHQWKVDLTQPFPFEQLIATEYKTEGGAL